MMRILFAYAVMFLAACVYGEADTPTPKQGETIEAKSLAEVRIDTNDPILTNKWYQLIAARAQKEGITMEEAARKVVAEHKQGKLQPIQQPQTTVPPRKKHWDKLLLVGVILGGVMVKQGKGLVRLFGCIIWSLPKISG